MPCQLIVSRKQPIFTSCTREGFHQQQSQFQLVLNFGCRAHHLPPFFLLPARSRHSTASTRSSLLSPSPLNAVLGAVPLTLETTPEQLGPRWREDRRTHWDARGAQEDTQNPCFCGTGCAQILAASTKPQSTALVQLKGSTDPLPARGMLQQRCCPTFPSHSFPPAGVRWHFPQSHPNGPLQRCSGGQLVRTISGLSPKKPARHRRHLHPCSSETQRPEAALLPGSHFLPAKCKAKPGLFTARKREPLQGPVGRADGSWHSAQAEKLQLQTLFCSDLYQDLAFPFFLPNGKKKKAFQVRGKKSIYSWVK